MNLIDEGVWVARKVRLRQRDHPEVTVGTKDLSLGWSRERPGLNQGGGHEENVFHIKTGWGCHSSV